MLVGPKFFRKTSYLIPYMDEPKLSTYVWFYWLENSEKTTH
jgi:hypothetical protein